MKISHVKVAVLAPLDKPLSYVVDKNLQDSIQIGSRVVVPLGKRKVIGVLLETETPTQNFEYKEIESVLDTNPLLSESYLRFLQWGADYYLTSLGEMIKTALPNSLTKISKSKERKVPEKKPFAGSIQNFQLSLSQQKIYKKILESTTSFKTHLIHGITGSGKTEIYLALIHQMIQKKKQVICMVPEIGLTPQTLKRFQEHFGSQVAVYHSNLSEKERKQTWLACQRGEISVLLGTRSALFAPFPNLGLIVIDEEQDHSYKQEERMHYHARDLAIVRAQIEKIPIVLGSATPSVETYDKALSGKFIYHPLLERYGEATLPEVKIIDLRHTPHSDQKHFLFSEELLAALAQNLAAKKQSLLFMNRRGFAHFVLCEDCGYRPLCPNCDISLTFHRGRKKMACHYCDYQIVPLDECPGCHGHQWLPVGSGTERIEEELQKHFPDARISRMDRDTTSQKGSHELILKKLEEGKIDILVGTQMITKGHDYPNVTLVGILLADSALNLPDFRSAERTYQLMTQVAGRSGRGIDAGQVLLQTFTPEHFSLQYAARHETKLFYDQEIELRRELEYPPFRRLIVLRLQGTQLGRVQQSIQHLKNHLDHLNQLQHWKAQILGPSPCLIEKIKNQYRWQIILKCPPGKLLQPVLRNEIMAQQKKWLSPGVRLVVDVDPIHVV